MIDFGRRQNGCCDFLTDTARLNPSSSRQKMHAPEHGRRSNDKHRNESSAKPTRQLKVGLAFNMKLGGDRMATVGLDVFNLFNFQAVTLVDETYTRDYVKPRKATSQTFQSPIVGLPPRGAQYAPR